MKKKVLFITPSLPVPADSGGKISSLASLEYLAKHFHLDLTCFVKQNENISNYTGELKSKNIKNIYEFNFNVRSRNLKNIILSCLKNIPLSIYRNESDKMFKNIEKLIAKNNYNIIYVDHWLMMQYVPANFKGEIILKEHNAEYIMWERAYNLEKKIFKKQYLKYETERIKKYECRICNKADYVIALTDEDKNNLVKIGVCENKIKILPAILLKNEDFTNKYYLPFEKRENTLLYVGTLSWGANIDGLIYFFNNIYPFIKQEFDDLKIYVVGKNPPASLQKYNDKDNSIILTGFVENLDEYYGKCKLFVAPLRYGSGIKIKILNAMAKAIPVISTEIGLEGINEGAVLAKNDKEFINKTINLLKDNKKLAELSLGSMNYLKKEYNESIYNEFYLILNCN